MLASDDYIVAICVLIEYVPWQEQRTGRKGENRKEVVTHIPCSLEGLEIHEFPRHVLITEIALVLL